MPEHLNRFDPNHLKLEKGRPVYVLLHKDKSHIYPNPDGDAAWSYEQTQIKVIETVLRKDYRNFDYHITTLDVAFPLICNKQAELEQAWRPEIHRIRRIKSLLDRRTHYKRFYARHKIPHPLLYDAELKRLLSF